jgi:transposase
MQYNTFIGIDISKLTIDVFIHGMNFHKQFGNDQQGFLAMLHWVRSSLKTDDLQCVMFCFEHTGFYSLALALFMEESQCPFSMVAPLEIKRSLGITRGKNDKIDSRRIAQYAYEKRSKLLPTKLPSKAILKLHPLMTLRDRLARDRGAFVGTKNEQLRFLPVKDNPVLLEAYDNVINALSQEIKRIEKAIKEIIKNDQALNKTFNLITSIKGVGFLIATYLIIYTHNFTRFDNWRKCACYGGIAPFENTSGTSIRGKTQVHPIANRQIKKMLHIAALTAAHTDKEMIAYFQKRIQGGKSKMYTLNVIRNKILARVFAVVKRGTKYVDLMNYAA